MLPPRTRLDPKGFYAVLGLDPAASREAIRVAFRRKARELHPDVPGTGDASAFVIVRQAYDVLSNRQRRESYDQAARQATANPSPRPTPKADASTLDADEPDWVGAAVNPRHPVSDATSRLMWRPRYADLPIGVWVGLGAFLCLCVIEATLHLRSPPVVVSTEIRPNAAPVTPLTPGAQRAVLYGPTPVQLAGTPNFYVIPTAGAAMLWAKDTARDIFVPIKKLPPFSTVQAVRLLPQNGLAEVEFNETTTGFVNAEYLTPGDADAARRAYCSYNAGSSPHDGELLERRGEGSGSVQLENRAVQPAVVKLRDASGAVALSVFLAPGGHISLVDIRAGTFRADFAIGELWSRACNSFAAGMRARRLAQTVTTGSDARLVVPPDQEAAAADISDQAFGQD